MAMTPVHEPFSFRELTAYMLKQAPDKDLISVVPYGWDTSCVEAFRDAELIWEFADDPFLVMMYRIASPKNVQVIIRASFMKKAAEHTEASTWVGLIKNLSAFAKKSGCLTRKIK